MRLASHKAVFCQSWCYQNKTKPGYNEIVSRSVYFSFFTQFLIFSFFFGSKHLVTSHSDIYIKALWFKFFKHVWPILTETWVLSTHGPDQQRVTESRRGGWDCLWGTSVLLLWNGRVRGSKTTSLLAASPEFIPQETDTYYIPGILSVLRDLVKNLRTKVQPFKHNWEVPHIIWAFCNTKTDKWQWDSLVKLVGKCF